MIIRKKIMKHETSKTQQAAALMSQKEFDVYYLECRPSVDREGWYDFIFEIDGDERLINEWIMDYINKKVCIEPKTYDSAMNVLRDHVKNQKARKGFQHGNS